MYSSERRLRGATTNETTPGASDIIQCESPCRLSTEGHGRSAELIGTGERAMSAPLVSTELPTVTSLDEHAAGPAVRGFADEPPTPRPGTVSNFNSRVAAALEPRLACCCSEMQSPEPPVR